MTPLPLGLVPQDLSSVLAILQQYVPEGEVWAFGSRVRGTARPFSDLDLVLINDEPLAPQIRAELKYALSESNLPVKVDLLEWARTSPPFREIILQDHLVLKPK